MAQEIAEMTRSDHSMLTMKIIKVLGIAGVAILVASFLAARNGRRHQDEERTRLDERLEKERWESEGGASRSGPATQSAITAH
jgi:beta-lactamase regulating signal transducer with metallopeptidase domain